MAIKEVELSKISADRSVQFREALDQPTVDRYAEILDVLPMMIVIQQEDALILADGFHRHAAFQKEGRTKVFADVRGGTLDDAKNISSTANVLHGLPLKLDERDASIVYLASTGVPHLNIAGKFGLTEQRISQIATAEGVRRRPEEVQRKARTTRQKAEPAVEMTGPTPGESEDTTENQPDSTPDVNDLHQEPEEQEPIENFRKPVEPPTPEDTTEETPPEATETPERKVTPLPLGENDDLSLGLTLVEWKAVMAALHHSPRMQPGVDNDLVRAVKRITEKSERLGYKLNPAYAVG